MKILFISRAYPPVIGGIEKQNYEIAKALAEKVELKIIANTRGKKFLPFFLIFVFFKALFCGKKYDAILLGDAVLVLPVYFLKLLLRRKVFVIVHGLDITFTNSVYQCLWVRFALPRMDALFAVGNETINQAVSRGVPESKCTFIPNGVNLSQISFDYCQAREALELDQSKKYIMTLGRLVRRKGVAWFIREVLPSLDTNVVYIVAGDGADRKLIDQAVEDTGMYSRVKLYGKVSEKEKQLLLQATDCFVQPNIPVQGDMEGFGLVVLEAGAAGLPVVASELEGLKDAIRHEQNGILVPPMDASAYIEVLQKILRDKDFAFQLSQRSKNYIAEHCLWSHVAQKYVSKMETLLASQ